MYTVFGMPTNEIELTKHFKDMHNLNIRIDASKKGWVITYADYSVDYTENEAAASVNMKNAVKYLKKRLKG